MLNEVQLKNRLKGNDEKSIKTLLIKFYKDDQIINLLQIFTIIRKDQKLNEKLLSVTFINNIFIIIFE
jgi:hypothetical protein